MRRGVRSWTEARLAKRLMVLLRQAEKIATEVNRRAKAQASHEAAMAQGFKAAPAVADTGTTPDGQASTASIAPCTEPPCPYPTPADLAQLELLEGRS